jgi:hypothetical protein
VKTASPEMLALAPNDLPWKIGPFLIVRVARSREIGVPFGRTYVCDRPAEVVWTVAMQRIWTIRLNELPAIFGTHCVRITENIMMM